MTFPESYPIIRIDTPLHHALPDVDVPPLLIRHEVNPATMEVLMIVFRGGKVILERPIVQARPDVPEQILMCGAVCGPLDDPNGVCERELDHPGRHVETRDGKLWAEWSGDSQIQECYPAHTHQYGKSGHTCKYCGTENVIGTLVAEK